MSAADETGRLDIDTLTTGASAAQQRFLQELPQLMRDTLTGEDSYPERSCRSLVTGSWCSPCFLPLPLCLPPAPSPLQSCLPTSPRAHVT